MQECETSTQDSYLKRVSVRSGGAGHAHSGVIKSGLRNGKAADYAVADKQLNSKIVRLGR
jgi:hypothetical protein